MSLVLNCRLRSHRMTVRLCNPKEFSKSFFLENQTYKKVRKAYAVNKRIQENESHLKCKMCFQTLSKQDKSHTCLCRKNHSDFEQMDSQVLKDLEPFKSQHDRDISNQILNQNTILNSANQRNEANFPEMFKLNSTEQHPPKSPPQNESGETLSQQFKSPKKSQFYTQNCQKKVISRENHQTPNGLNDMFYLDRKNLYTRQEIYQLNKLKQLIRAKRKDSKLQIDIKFNYHGKQNKDKFIKDQLAAFSNSNNYSDRERDMERGSGGQRQRERTPNNNNPGFWAKLLGIFGCE